MNVCVKKSGRWGPYRQASPPPARHCPGARSARRGGRRHPIADHNAKETTMWFRSLLDSMKTRPVRALARQKQRNAARRLPATGRLLVEHLEDRCLPSQYSILQLPLDPRDVNNHGQVVGYTPVTGHAAFWQDGALIDLGSLAGPAGQSIAYGINNTGQVVGSTQVAPGGYYSGAAFLVTPEDTNHDGAPD